MKKLWITFIFILALGISEGIAQDYTTAIGLGLDFGDGATLVGPSAKYFFSQHHAGQGEVLFGNGVTAITALYAYQDGFSGSDSALNWFAGAGATIFFGDGNSDVGLRGTVGLELKIPDVPLAVSADWRPYLSFDNGSEMGRFGLGVRYILN